MGQASSHVAHVWSPVCHLLCITQKMVTASSAAVLRERHLEGTRKPDLQEGQAQAHEGMAEYLHMNRSYQQSGFLSSPGRLCPTERSPADQWWTESKHQDRDPLPYT
jgi:hypothetical protein